jgi:hypothetical protein
MTSPQSYNRSEGVTHSHQHIDLAKKVENIYDCLDGIDDILDELPKEQWINHFCGERDACRELLLFDEYTAALLKFEQALHCPGRMTLRALYRFVVASSTSQTSKDAFLFLEQTCGIRISDQDKVRVLAIADSCIFCKVIHQSRVDTDKEDGRLCRMPDDNGMLERTHLRPGTGVAGPKLVRDAVELVLSNPESVVFDSLCWAASEFEAKPEHFVNNGSLTKCGLNEMIPLILEGLLGGVDQFMDPAEYKLFRDSIYAPISTVAVEWLTELTREKIRILCEQRCLPLIWKEDTSATSL